MDDEGDGEAVIVRALISVGLVLYACVARPDRATCDVGWYVSGIRPSGNFSCVQAPPPNERDCTADAACPQPSGPEVEVGSRIYCTGGSVAIVRDHMTVGCMRRFE